MSVTSSDERDFVSRMKHILLGKPLPSHEAPHQTISKKVGLAVFASDALSSTAYATEAILEVLAVAVPLAGLAVLGYSVWISLAIIFLLIVVTISYQQTIHAYPGGGGAYIVARNNLGLLPAQVAGAALLTDYILTVSVSISSGVAQLSSAFPSLLPYRTWIAVVIVLLMMLINLRGVKESGVTFSIPTYFFLGVTIITIGVGFYKYFSNNLDSVSGITPSVIEATRGVTLFLILHAFSSGCTALTGVEAISNGITAFKEPKSRNAAVTLVWMSGILSLMFFGITFLANRIEAQFSPTETIMSQLGRTIWGTNLLWYILLGSTTLILIMAANTSFADFPRLGAIAASDGFLPRQLTYRGSRLVFSNGIVALGGLASLLIIIFNAETTSLIPLYAIGVFLSFSLSQSGMAIHWWKSKFLRPGDEIHEQGGIVKYDPRWLGKMIINTFGALLTATVMCVFAVTKFMDGAWIVIILIPLLVLLFLRIHSHYKDVAANLSLEDYGEAPRVQRNRVLLLIGGVHRGVLHALRYARSLSHDLTAVYVAYDDDEKERLKRKWAIWGDGVRLHIIESPYRRLVEPLVLFIDEMAEQLDSDEMLTVVVPHFIPQKSIYQGLHMNTASLLRKVLLKHRDIVIMEVPYHLSKYELDLMDVDFSN